MVSAALTAFALRWRIILRAFSGLTAMFNTKTKDKDVFTNRDAYLVVYGRSGNGLRFLCNLWAIVL